MQNRYARSIVFVKKFLYWKDLMKRSIVFVSVNFRELWEQYFLKPAAKETRTYWKSFFSNSYQVFCMKLLSCSWIGCSSSTGNCNFFLGYGRQWKKFVNQKNDCKLFCIYSRVMGNMFWIALQAKVIEELAWREYYDSIYFRSLHYWVQYKYIDPRSIIQLQRKNANKFKGNFCISTAGKLVKRQNPPRKKLRKY